MRDENVKNIQDKLMMQFQKMDTAYENYARSKGLNYLGLMVMHDIYVLGDGCTQKQICEDTHYPKQSINLTVKAFLKDGYIELIKKPENLKNRYISLTDKGRAFCDEVVVPLMQREERAMTSMGEERSRQLFRLLEMYAKEYCDGVGELTEEKSNE